MRLQLTLPSVTDTQTFTTTLVRGWIGLRRRDQSNRNLVSHFMFLLHRGYATLRSNIAHQLDLHVLPALGCDSLVNLPTVFGQYQEHARRVLPVALPYESRPNSERRLNYRDSVVLVAHALRRASGEHKVAVSSGFALSAGSTSWVLTCAHTLQETHHFQGQQLIDDKSSSFVVSHDVISPVKGVVASRPRSDLLILDAPKGLPSLPASPYPAQNGTCVLAHFVSYAPPKEPDWEPWMYGTWRKWVRGHVLGYKDLAGNEAKPGTYDALSHMLFHPPPTAGSSGGPIIDEESGAVVGVMLGTRLDNVVGGVKGWGVPAEAIFEMFSLPGLEGKN